MIENQEDFTRRVEEAIVNIGKEHAKILAAQITALVQEVRQGNSAQAYLLWKSEDAPKGIKELVADHANYPVWVLYVPQELRNHHQLPMFGGLDRIAVDLPASGQLFVYRQPI